jgi:branched-chain amino acid transport system ATP-binding protein
MLALKQVSAGYDSGNVVHDIDLRVDAGEIVALVGANGAGKSTLVKAISGIIPIRRGDILFDGRSIIGAGTRDRVLNGLVQVPEGRQIFGGLTVGENLRLGGYARDATAAQVAEKIAKIGALFPVLLQRLNDAAGNLSGGQQQMLAIGRGLMADPRVLILDEPSLGLSPILVAEIFQLIAGLRKEGRGILLSEQNARLSLAIADRGYVIENGRVVLTGTGAELLNNPDVAARYLGVGKGFATDGRPSGLAERLGALLHDAKKSPPKR